jgi:hypothetical protein
VKPDGLLVFSEHFVHHAIRGGQQVNRSLAEIESLLRKVGFEPLGETADVRADEYPVDSTSRVHRLCWRVLAMAAGTRSARCSGRVSIRSSWRWSLT